MTPEEKALRDAYLAELWPTCPEVSREQRAVDRALSAATTVRVDDTLRAHKTAPVGAVTPDPGPGTTRQAKDRWHV